MKRLFYYYLYLFIVWGCFRYFVRLPEVIEELWFKPIIWMTPLFWWSLTLKSKGLIMFGADWISSLGLGLVLGFVYYILLSNKYNHQETVVLGNVLGVILATSVIEELTFSGFIAGYLETLNKGKWINLLLVGFMVAGIRLPILLFVYKADLQNLLGVLLLTGSFGAINAWVRVRTGNVAGSILARVGLGLAVFG